MMVGGDVPLFFLLLNLDLHPTTHESQQICLLYSVAL